jgi:hypothetical protein
LWRIFQSKGGEVTKAGENCIMRSFISCTLRQTLLERSNQDEIARTCSKHETEMYTKFWGDNLKKRDHYDDVYVDGRIIWSRVYV